MLPKKYVLRFPDGELSFIITPKAFHDFLEHNNLETKISHILGTIHAENSQSRITALKAVKDLILKGDFPKNLLSEILLEYKRFGGILDGKEIHISFLKDNEADKVKGDSALLHKIKEKWSSLFLPHPTFDNPTIIIEIKPPLFKKIKENTKAIEDKLEERLGSIINNSGYISS